MKLNNSKIKLTKRDKLLKIRFPNHLNNKLAHFLGIHIGDGFMNYYENKKDYRIVYSGHSINEKKWYENVLKKLIKNLFIKRI